MLFACWINVCILDKEEVQRKRMKALPQPYDHWRGGPQGGAGGFGGPGAGTGGGGGGMGGGDEKSTFSLSPTRSIWNLNKLLIILSVGYQFNHTMDNSGFFVPNCGFGGGTQMSSSAPQTDGSQNQPTNTQAQPDSQMQQHFIQIGESNWFLL